MINLFINYLCCLVKSMKKIVLFLILVLFAICSCEQEEVSCNEVTNYSLTVNDSLVPVSSPYSDLYQSLRKHMRTRSSSVSEVGITDILGFPVTIQVVENIYNKKYLKYNGVHKAVTLSDYSANDEDNLFVLHEDVFTDEVYITPYKLSDNKYYLGAASSKGSSVITLAALSGTPENGGYWEVSKGQTEYSFVLKNTQVLDLGADLSSLALAVEDNQLKFQKYS